MYLFAIIVPVILTIIAFFIFKEKLTRWELILPSVTCFIFILVFNLAVEKGLTADTEYWGYLGNRAEYYEYWETWVSRTCTESYPCGTDSNGNTTYCTRTYDCSYCDKNNPKWLLISTSGKSHEISKEKYLELKKRWNSSETFVDLNRRITKNYRCGQDGDMYYIKWNGNIYTSEQITEKKYYENRIKVSKNAFNFKDISDEEKEFYGLYDYPKVTGYTQNALIYNSDISLSKSKLDSLNKSLKYINGKLGPKQELKLFVLLFEDKPEMSANFQEAYWKGGNKNEMVVCIGLEKGSSDIKWVRSFSWTPNRTMLVDIREELMNTGSLNSNLIFKKLYEILDNYQRRSFSEFKYLQIEMPLWSIITSYLFTICISIGVIFWSVTNEFESPDLNWKFKKVNHRNRTRRIKQKRLI
jgi:hypothetical protein